MHRVDMLARLMAEAQAKGSDLVTLRAIVEEASDLGADRALARMGLADAKAQADLGELRELLGAWRDAKKSARKAVFAWVLRGLTALLLIGLAGEPFLVLDPAQWARLAASYAGMPLWVCQVGSFAAGPALRLAIL